MTTSGHIAEPPNLEWWQYAAVCLQCDHCGKISDFSAQVKDMPEVAPKHGWVYADALEGEHHSLAYAACPDCRQH